jgi:DNA-binding NarL/FixJ family response regulator
MTKITILIVDDHAVVRQGLRALVSAEPDMQVVGEAANGREALQLTGEFAPEVVVMDVAMPEMSGLAATREIMREHPGTRILVLSSYGDEDTVQQILQAGASGYLLKQTAANELSEAIRQVRRGNTYIAANLAQRLRKLQTSGPGGRPGPARRTLTAREVQVLQLIAEGLSNKEIAKNLGISAKTVEKHRQQVMNKLGIHEIAGLTRYAISKGMLENVLD